VPRSSPTPGPVCRSALISVDRAIMLFQMFGNRCDDDYISAQCRYKKASRKGAKIPGKAGNRWYKNVGLGFKTPKEAIEGKYIDKKCPFTGDVSIRGRILSGKVVSTKMHRTIVLRRDYLHYIKKYQRYEKRHTNISAHISPCFRCNEGDTVTVGQCRPLSKTVRFNVLRVIPAGAANKKGFSGF
jgi:small subunit ribosomal protein S11e